MDENSMTKASGIPQIVRLKEILQKWHNVTLGPNNNNNSSSSSSNSNSNSNNNNDNNNDNNNNNNNNNSNINSNSNSNNNNHNKHHIPSPTHPPHAGISPSISNRLRGCSVYDSDEESCHSPEPPLDVPKGYLAVYVGLELRRFIIPTSYLSDPLFKVLLEKVEEEFGFDHSGGLTIPCETETFKYLLKCMENHQKQHCIGGSSLTVED